MYTHKVGYIYMVNNHNRYLIYEMSMKSNQIPITNENICIA